MRLSCGRLFVGQGVPGLLTRLEVRDDFQHLLEEKLGVIRTLSPMCVYSRDSSLGTLRQFDLQAFFARSCARNSRAPM